MEASGDKTGDKAILENTTFTLECKIRGKPRPTLSWTLNGKTLSSGRNFDASEGMLKVLRASIRYHQGVYRCLATSRYGTIMSRRIQVQVTGKKISVSLSYVPCIGSLVLYSYTMCNVTVSVCF